MWNKYRKHMMKKKQWWLLPAVCVGMLMWGACSTDDPDPNAFDFDEHTATGTWKIDSVKGFYDMKYFLLDKKFTGGTLQLNADGAYHLTNGDGTWSQTGTWKAGRWYVVLTANNGVPDTLQLMSPRDGNRQSWKNHLDFYKKQQAKAATGGYVTLKEMQMFTTREK